MVGSLNLNSAVMGIQRGFEGMQNNASDIARATTTNVDSAKSITESLIDLRVNQHQVSASVEAFKTVDDMIGTLLDIKA